MLYKLTYIFYNVCIHNYEIVIYSFLFLKNSMRLCSALQKHESHYLYDFPRNASYISPWGISKSDRKSHDPIYRSNFLVQFVGFIGNKKTLLYIQGYFLMRNIYKSIIINFSLYSQLLFYHIFGIDCALRVLWTKVVVE